MTKAKKIYTWDDFSEPNFMNTENYLPPEGDGENMGTQASTALSKIIYKWFNDGDVYDNRYGMGGWANDISGSANWLYRYIPETKTILNRIKDIGYEDEDAYTEILYDLISLVDPMIPELANKPKQGDAYCEDGPFEFVTHRDEDWEEDEDW